MFLNVHNVFAYITEWQDAHHFIYDGRYFSNMCLGFAWPHHSMSEVLGTTSLAPPLFIEMPVQRRREWAVIYLCLRSIYSDAISVFLLVFGTFLMVLYYYFHLFSKSILIYRISSGIS